MDLRSLIGRMDAIERRSLNEAFNIKNVQDAVGNIADATQRHAALASLAQQNSLPGLYDPVEGDYVSATGAVSNTADKDTDYKLSSMGLIPKNANTSTFLGKVFGSSGDKYDQGLRAQSDKTVANQTSEDFKKAKLGELNTLMKELEGLKKIDAPAETPAATPATAPATTPAAASTPATGGQGATPVAQSVTQNANGTFTLTKKDGTKFNISADGKVVKEERSIDLSKSLIESFGYQVNEAAVAPTTFPGGELGKTAATAATGYGIGKAITHAAGRAIPGAGTALSIKDAYDRWQAGDKSGAVISVLAGAGWLIPGPAGWVIGGGLDAANLTRDYLNKKQEPAAQAALPAAPTTASKADPKVIAVQKYLKSQGADLGATGPNKDGIDGIMGAKTRAAMDAANLSESQRITLLKIQLESLSVDEGLKDVWNAAKTGWSGEKVATGALTRAGNPQVVGQDTKAFQKALAARPAGERAAYQASKFTKANPGKLAAGAAVAGAGAYGLSKTGGADNTAPVTPVGGGGGGTGSTTQGATPAKQICSPEQMSLISKIRGVMGQLADYEDTAVQQLLQNYQTKIDALDCSSTPSASAGQGATPAAGKGYESNAEFYDRISK